jgi:cold shock protein
VHRGRVKWFDNAKGFGFVAVDAAGDVFVHYADIKAEGLKTLVPGQEVELEVEPSPKGPVGRRVTLL